MLQEKRGEEKKSRLSFYRAVIHHPPRILLIMGKLSTRDTTVCSEKFSMFFQRASELLHFFFRFTININLILNVYPMNKPPSDHA